MTSAEATDLLDRAELSDSSNVTPRLGEILDMHGLEFVQCAYRMMVVRSPDPAGISFYLGRLLDGVPKIQILAEMGDSKEARSLAINPPGLARAMFLLRCSRLPLLGRFFSRLSGVEGYTPRDIRLRVVEEMLNREIQAEELARQKPMELRPAPRALIAKSGLFDPDWYAKQSPELSADIDLLDHFLARGGVEGRAASALFDCQSYLDRYVDVRRAGLNPLGHFLMQGEKEGRQRFTVTEARAQQQATAQLIIRHEIHCLKALEVSAEVAVFVTYSPDGFIKPFVRHYIGALRRHGIGVVLIISASHPVQAVDPDVLDLLCGLFVRERKGDEFAAWAHVLQLHPELYAASILYLLDDSAFGPLDEVKFTSFIGHIRASTADMIELRDDTDHRNPVHAYFRAFKPRALSSVALQRFVNESSLPCDLDSSPAAESLPLPALLRAQGLKVEEPLLAPDLAVEADVADRALSKWNKITQKGFPFVDVTALDRARAAANWPDWQLLLQKMGYDTRLLDGALRGTGKSTNEESLAPVASSIGRRALVSGPRLAPTLPLRVAFIGPWNLQGEEGFASRGFVSALWHTEFLLNLHPIRHPFHHHAQLTPTVDCLSFSGAADLVIVHLNPDEWPRMLSTTHWEILSGARKIVGAWTYHEERVPASWRPALDTMDAIWAPSQYCADVIQRSTRVQVEVIPICLPVCQLHDEEARTAALCADLGIAQGRHIILGCIEGGASLERQNPSGLLAAFEKSALASEGWVLAICAESSLELTADGRRVLEDARQIPGAMVINRPANPATMDALFAVADVYASAHRSDNVGLWIAQAMAHGKSVVATDFGGCQDFLDATSGYPVPAVLRAAQHGLCAVADSAILTASLRQAAGKIMTGDLSVGLAARERIRVRNSPQAVAQSVQLAALTLLEVR